ncbi:unnamed protein product, partial [Tetraodon nigroviridis]
PEDALADFSVRLYQQLQAGGEQDNLVFSPLSVAVALGMVGLGARGASLEQLRQVAGVPHLLPGEGVTFNPEFLRLMRKYFKAEVETVDFSQPAAVAQQINSWVENRTEGKIGELLAAEDLSTITRLALVNAVYFRGSWKNQFRPENTRAFSFSRDDGSECPQELVLPGAVMVILCGPDENPVCWSCRRVQRRLPGSRGRVPGAGDALRGRGHVHDDRPSAAGSGDLCPPWSSIIKAPLLEDWANNVKLQKVEVYLPRFKVEQKMDLRKTLQELGIKSIFSTEADLSAMTDGKDLYIGKAVQKAYLEVTEEGSEGAAGSGMMALTRTLVLYPQVMADHPFFFVVRERRTGAGHVTFTCDTERQLLKLCFSCFAGSILFMGRVTTPEVIDAGDGDFDSL